MAAANHHGLRVFQLLHILKRGASHFEMSAFADFFLRDKHRQCEPAGAQVQLQQLVQVEGQGDHKVEQGESVSITFDEPGTYDYVCTLHSQDMDGTVIVK